MCNKKVSFDVHAADHISLAIIRLSSLDLTVKLLVSHISEHSWMIPGYRLPFLFLY